MRLRIVLLFLAIAAVSSSTQGGCAPSDRPSHRDEVVLHRSLRFSRRQVPPGGNHYDDTLRNTLSKRRSNDESIAQDDKEYEQAIDRTSMRDLEKAKEERKAQHEEDLEAAQSDAVDGEIGKAKEQSEQDKEDDNESDDKSADIGDSIDTNNKNGTSTDEKSDDKSKKGDDKGEQNTADHSHVLIPSVDPNLIHDPLLRNVTLTYKHLHSHRPPPVLKSVEAVVSSSSSSSSQWSSSGNGSKPINTTSKHVSPPQMKTHMIIDMVPDRAPDDIEAFIGAIRDYLASLDDEKRKTFEKAFLSHADDDDKYALARAMDIDVVRHVYTGVHRGKSNVDTLQSTDTLAANASANATTDRIQGALIPPRLASLLKEMGSPPFQPPSMNTNTEDDQTPSSLFAGMPTPFTPGFAGPASLESMPVKRNKRPKLEKLV